MPSCFCFLPYPTWTPRLSFPFHIYKHPHFPDTFVAVLSCYQHMWPFLLLPYKIPTKWYINVIDYNDLEITWILPCCSFLSASTADFCSCFLQVTKLSPLEVPIISRQLPWLPYIVSASLAFTSEFLCASFLISSFCLVSKSKSIHLCFRTYSFLYPLGFFLLLKVQTHSSLSSDYKYIQVSQILYNIYSSVSEATAFSCSC